MPHRLAEHGGIAAEAFLPEAERDHDVGGVVAREDLADERRRAQQRKDARRDRGRRHAIGVAADGHDRRSVLPGANRFDRRRALEPRQVREARDQERHLARRADVRFGEADEAIWLGPRQRPHEHAVGHAHERRHHADRDRHRGDGDDAEAALARGEADRVAEVLDEAGEAARARARRVDDRRPLRGTPQAVGTGDPRADELGGVRVGFVDRRAARARGVVRALCVRRQLLDDLGVERAAGARGGLADFQRPVHVVFLTRCRCPRRDRARPRSASTRCAAWRGRAGRRR